jgi:hypothetical protein
VEAAGGQRVFAGSVSSEERGADEIRWVVERLATAHSYSYQRELDWDQFERSARLRIAAACSPADYLRAWEWALARLHDRHTRVLAIGGSSPCHRVHCGIYGRFVSRSRFIVEHVWPRSAAVAAGVVAGMMISGVAGGDWPTYLRHENPYWASSTRHFRRAIQRFIPWYQPNSTRLELLTDAGVRAVEFGDTSYPGFFHWLYDGEPEPVTFGWLGADRYRLRISYFPPGQGFVDCCEQLLSLVPGRGSLELDLRGNAGGNAETSVRVAEMLLKPGAPLARRRSRRVGGHYTRWTVLRSDSHPVYLGPLTALMDEFCASSCEMLLGALKANGRGMLVGRRSAGSTGNPRKYVTERGVEFLCSSWEETTPNGETIEGVGIGP